MKKILMAAVALVAMVACCGNADNANLENTNWKLSQMEGISAEAINAEEDAFVLSLASEAGEYSGRTNCNRFFGTYEVKGDKLTLGEAGTTRMACPDMESESAFLQMLAKVNGYSIKGNELTLTDADKKTLAVFQVVPECCEKAAAKECEGACEGCTSKCEGEKESCGDCEKACDGEMKACGAEKSCEGEATCGEKKACDAEKACESKAACGEKKACEGCPSNK